MTSHDIAQFLDTTSLSNLVQPSFTIPAAGQVMRCFEWDASRDFTVLKGSSALFMICTSIPASFDDLTSYVSGIHQLAIIYIWSRVPCSYPPMVWVPRYHNNTNHTFHTYHTCHTYQTYHTFQTYHVYIPYQPYMPNIPYISNIPYMRQLHTILTIPTMPYILSYIHYPAPAPHTPHHTPRTTHPTTPPGGRGTVLWLTHDHGWEKLERWTIYTYIYIHTRLIHVSKIFRCLVDTWEEERVTKTIMAFGVNMDPVHL